MRVGFCGMGKLGLPVALAVESKGHQVWGYDVSSLPYEYLREKKIPYKEKGLQPLLNTNKIRTVQTVDELVENTDLIFVPVQTPHKPEYEGDVPLPITREDFDYSYLRDAIFHLANSAKAQKKSIIIATISTCLPGTFSREIKHLLNEYTHYVYTPQFIAMGTVLEDYLYPEFNLIGVEDELAAKTLEKFYETINEAPHVKTDITTAEGIKVSYNTWITAKTVIANTWGELAHKTGMNFDDIHKAWSLSGKRLLSNRYMDSGVGDGGGCFPAGELVMTRDGMKPIESIEPGVEVLTSDGSFQKVVKRWERDYDGDLVVVQVRGLPKVKMTVEHPILVRKDGRPRVPDGRRNTYHKIIDKLHSVTELRADHLTLDSMIGWPKFKKSGAYSISNRSFAYLAGWYLAEGSVELDSRRGRVRFDLHAKEYKDAKDIETWLMDCKHNKTNNRGKTAKVTHKVAGNSRSVRFGNMGLAQELVSNFGKGSSDKHIPAKYLWGNIRDAEALLWGLIRGDGHRGENGISYSTISKDLAWGVFIILHRLELNPTLREIPPRGNHKAAYEVRVRNRRQASKLCEIVGWKSYDYDKEIQTYADDGNNVWRHVQKLEREAYKGKVHNLWVEKNHTYVVGCGAVHNCHPRDNIAMSYIAERVNLSHNLFEDLMASREEHMAWLASIGIEKSMKYELPLYILGKAFKPETNIETGSPAILMANIIKEIGYSVYNTEDLDTLAPGVYIIGTKHERYTEYDFPEGSIVIDPFRRIPRKEGVEVIHIGGYNL